MNPALFSIAEESFFGLFLEDDGTLRKTCFNAFAICGSVRLGF